MSWTPETAQSFEELKEAIHNFQKLYFLDDCNRVILETDASDYGIGAYLRQEIDGKDYPVMFISKSFTSAQLRWSVPEKEGYAIVYAFIKMEHLLRDRHFDLYTDHENLTRLYSTGSQKVMRWRMYMQEYNFTIHYKKGEENTVADAFSRLCDVSDREQYLTALEEYICKDDSIYRNTQCRGELNALNENLKPIPNDVYNRIRAVHNSVVGHLGVERTMRRLLRQKYSIDYLREYVRAFIKQCPLCLKMAMITPVIVTRPFTVTSSAPMVNINIDYLYMSIEDFNGNKFVLVVIDTFTRFTE